MTGCGGWMTKTEYVQPHCVAPVRAEPPEISGQQLDPLPDNVYWKVRTRDTMLVNEIDVRQTMLEKICGDN